MATAAQVPSDVLRRAQMLVSDLDRVSDLAFREGEPGLRALSLSLFRPVQPMLADTAKDVEGRARAVGLRRARIQAGRCARAGTPTRRRNPRLHAHAERCQRRGARKWSNSVAALPVREIILDGEVIALREDGSPLPSQETMRRFGRRLNVRSCAKACRSRCSSSTLFALRRPRLARRSRPQSAAACFRRWCPQSARVPRIITDDAKVAQAFLDASLATGHEGVMAKACDAPYAAGKRGSNWLKIKHVHTLDLVVLACEWGSGRRTGLLSNLHLGARTDDGFVMLGKTFKGLTDELLRFQTEALLARETRRDRYTVYVRPELVVEVAFSDIQKSPRYPAGLALRLARIKRYRSDKPAAEADTIDQVRDSISVRWDA